MPLRNSGALGSSLAAAMPHKQSSRDVVIHMHRVPVPEADPIVAITCQPGHSRKAAQHQGPEAEGAAPDASQPMSQAQPGEERPAPGNELLPEPKVCILPGIVVRYHRAWGCHGVLTLRCAATR